ncbi:MAG: transglutaminase domain-containing protein [Bacteroidales bacterium]|nr:transglutaminase domain-containing protein [Bacteroidales bacterium]
MKRRFTTLLLALAAVFAANSQTYRAGIALDANLTPTEAKYMKFLYDYMPLSDLSDYTQGFFLRQVRATLEAKTFFHWGKTIPDEVFMHFVLPLRVNNENLDTARIVFFEELKERIKGLTMYEAIKEVNHWCHEKVNYRASDGRTSSPLATVRTSWGRCGEESTFTVSALRAVGIPARQCYTPRWAHTDDNHAWVEAWADGKWYYFGACEPDVELNSGWFDSPVKRAMMVHTTVFGKYDGSEQKNYETNLYSRINLLSNYTAVKTLKVIVTDPSGKPIKDAEVDFGLYNYAEYYPLSRNRTNADGEAVLNTGLGDLMISVTDGTRFKLQKAAAEDTLCKIVLASADCKPYYHEFILTPPVEKIVKAKSDEAVAANAKRLAYEDSLREAYIHTFPQYTDPKRLQPNYIPTHADSLTDKSWGNYDVIKSVLNADLSQKNGNQKPIDCNPFKLALLDVIYDKDLRDIEMNVINDHVFSFSSGKPPLKGYDEETINKYILNPRIQLEKLTPWRLDLQSTFGKQATAFRNDPQRIAKWINENISLSSENYYGQPISPKGVLKTMEADNLSRDILFVAICRSLGIAARYEWATQKAQYRMPKGSWTYAALSEDDKAKDENVEMTKVIVKSSESNIKKPEYYSHFTLSKLINGRFHTLDYEYDPHFADFPDTLSLSNGYYRLLSGTRADDGSVKVREEFFNLDGNDTTLYITLPKADFEPKILAKISLEQTSVAVNSKSTTLKSLCGEDGLLIAFVKPSNEPTKHLIADFATLKNEFETSQIGIITAICDDNVSEKMMQTLKSSLPNQTIFEQNEAKKILNAVLAAIKYDFGNNFPLLIFINPNGEVVFLSEGYRIASPDAVLKTIRVSRHKQ